MKRKKIKTIPWDSAKHLKTEEDMALYLDAMVEESKGDPASIALALGNIARDP